MRQNAITPATGRRLQGILFALCLFPLLFCGSSPGQFGFKTWQEDSYRQKKDPLEFSTKDEIQWVFRLSGASSPRTIGVVYQKKEIVWVDMDSSSQRVDATNRYVYGTIKDFPPGEYRLVLVEAGEGNRLISERFFTVYNDEDPEPESTPSE
ncbi:MAG: hypothetical protein JXA20_06195 [Spirochaetes bacterium]|nr:hypothetical protein [Spirochaetota bacterium]